MSSNFFVLSNADPQIRDRKIAVAVATRVSKWQIITLINKSDENFALDTPSGCAYCAWKSKGQIGLSRGFGRVTDI